MAMPAAMVQPHIWVIQELSPPPHMAEVATAWQTDSGSPRRCRHCTTVATYSAVACLTASHADDDIGCAAECLGSSRGQGEGG